MGSKRQLDGGAVQTLRLHQAWDALLPERRGVRSQVIESAERRTENVAAKRHRVLPHARIDAESGQDGRRSIVDRAALVGTHDATGPVDELEIGFERKNGTHTGHPSVFGRGWVTLGSSQMMSLVRALIFSLIFISTATAGVQRTGKVARIQPPDAARDCVFFQLDGVPLADPAIPSGGSWYAIPRSHNGFKEIYAMLLWAKSMGLQVSLETTGVAAPGACAGFVGVTHVYTTE